ncbi:MAG: ligase-associated DNA damage response exonuclease [Kiritimatiellia bacterium]
MPRLLEHTPAGLHCAIGGFTIDPYRGVDRAVITHAHGDHARPGSKHVLTSASGARLVRARVGDKPTLQELPFGEPVNLNGVLLSLHPAGHILGSAQVRLEHAGEVWVVTGDYKRGADATCEAFEPVRCDVLVTEGTFGLPVYGGPSMDLVRREISDWWRANRAAGRASVIFGYALGKAQRVLSLLDEADGPIIVHGAVEQFVNLYRAAGVKLPATIRGNAEPLREHRDQGLFIAPPGADGTRWLRKLAPCETAFASGWMAVRGSRRQRGVDRGFVVSDHVDWPELVQTVRESGAREVWAMHGSTGPFVRWLNENGWTARELRDESRPARAAVPEDDEDVPADPATAARVPSRAGAAEREHRPPDIVTPPPDAPPRVAARGFADFAALVAELHRSTRPDDQAAAIERYFRAAPAADAAWALHLLAGGKGRRIIPAATLRQWAAEASGFPAWLVGECIDQVGDASETLALLLPDADPAAGRSLADVMTGAVLALRDLAPDDRPARIRAAWAGMSAPARIIYNRLLTTGFRSGVYRGPLARALAGIAGIDPAEMAHRLVGGFEPDAARYPELLRPAGGVDDPGKPYPFLLALPLDGDPARLGDPARWLVEWKWDGIRAQILRRGRACMIWTRGEEMIGDQFPSLSARADALPPGTVLDGEILPGPDGGRFIAYDLIEEGGRDLRSEPLATRRQRLVPLAALAGFTFSAPVPFDRWEALAPLRAAARQHGAEGLMFKRLDGVYAPGREPGLWWKWKTDPFSADAVLVYAQAGSGGVYSAITLGVWSEGRIVPVCKIESGLSAAGQESLDRFVLAATLEKFGPVRAVRPELVFEIAFDGVLPSTRHKSGVTLRNPRVLRPRPDKTAPAADTLESIQAHLV